MVWIRGSWRTTGGGIDDQHAGAVSRSSTCSTISCCSQMISTASCTEAGRRWKPLHQSFGQQRAQGTSLGWGYNGQNQNGLSCRPLVFDLPIFVFEQQVHSLPLSVEQLHSQGHFAHGMGGARQAGVKPGSPPSNVIEQAFGQGPAIEILRRQRCARLRSWQC